MWKRNALRGKDGLEQARRGCGVDASSTKDGLSRASTEHEAALESWGANGMRQNKMGNASRQLVEKILFAAAGIGTAVGDADAAVHGFHLNRRAAVAEIGFKMVLNLAVNRDREIDRNAAVDGAGFKVR